MSEKRKVIFFTITKTFLEITKSVLSNYQDIFDQTKCSLYQFAIFLLISLCFISFRILFYGVEHKTFSSKINPNIKVDNKWVKSYFQR